MDKNKMPQEDHKGKLVFFETEYDIEELGEIRSDSLARYMHVRGANGSWTAFNTKDSPSSVDKLLAAFGIRISDMLSEPIDLPENEMKLVDAVTALAAMRNSRSEDDQIRNFLTDCINDLNDLKGLLKERREFAEQLQNLIITTPFWSNDSENEFIQRESIINELWKKIRIIKDSKRLAKLQSKRERNAMRDQIKRHMASCTSSLCPLSEETHSFIIDLTKDPRVPENFRTELQVFTSAYLESLSANFFKHPLTYTRIEAASEIVLLFNVIESFMEHHAKTGSIKSDIRQRKENDMMHLSGQIVDFLNRLTRFDENIRRVQLLISRGAHKEPDKLEDNFKLLCDLEEQRSSLLLSLADIYKNAREKIEKGSP